MCKLVQAFLTISCGVQLLKYLCNKLYGSFTSPHLDCTISRPSRTHVVTMRVKEAEDDIQGRRMQGLQESIRDQCWEYESKSFVNMKWMYHWGMGECVFWYYFLRDKNLVKSCVSEDLFSRYV